MENKRLVFKVADNCYALNLGLVVEIVGRISPQTEDNKIFVQVRKDKIPCFKMEWPMVSTTCIIMNSSKGYGALVVDEIYGIFREKDFHFHPLPLSLSKESLQNFLGVLEIKSLKIEAYDLNFENFLKYYDSDFQGFKEKINSHDDQLKKETLQNQKFSTFIEIPISDHKSAGLSVNIVERIIPFKKPSPIVGLPEFAIGLINVEGSIIPLLDLSKRLGEEASPQTQARIIVFLVDNTKWGLKVTKISNLRQIPQDQNIVEQNEFGHTIEINEHQQLMILEPKKLVNF